MYFIVDYCPGQYAMSINFFTFIDDLVAYVKKEFGGKNARAIIPPGELERRRQVSVPIGKYQAVVLVGYT